jgi:hypothetical protein
MKRKLLELQVHIEIALILVRKPCWLSVPSSRDKTWSSTSTGGSATGAMARGLPVRCTIIGELCFTNRLYYLTSRLRCKFDYNCHDCESYHRYFPPSAKQITSFLISFICIWVGIVLFPSSIWMIWIIPVLLSWTYSTWSNQSSGQPQPQHLPQEKVKVFCFQFQNIRVVILVSRPAAICFLNPW